MWSACHNGGGYGMFKLGGRMRLTHRLTYRLSHGEIPRALEIDHLCRVRNCCNPAHLEAVTRLENVRRGNQGKAQRARAACAQGHPYDETNTHYTNDGKRSCRECHRQWSREFARRSKT